MSSQVKKEVKVVILLSPQELENDYLVLQGMIITRMGTMINRDFEETGMAFLKKFFPDLPIPAKEILAQFRPEKLMQVREQIKVRFTKHRAGIPFQTYLQNALIRTIHEMLESLKPYSGLIHWHHKLTDTNQRVRIAPCSFSSFKPGLQFKVVKNQAGLNLVSLVHLNGTNYALGEFTRYHFFLESNGEYFLLAHKDYQTLEWLEVNNNGQYNHQPELFAENILSRLEEDYPVNRNNLFEVNEIRSRPENRVMLSEISQSFLVLTPQWIYEGFTIEGPWKEKVEFVRQGKTYVVYRDKDVENTFRKRLEELHPKFTTQLNGYYYLPFAEAQKKQWFLKVYHKLLDENIQLAGMDMLQHFRYSAHKVQVDTSIISNDTRSVTLQAEVKFGEEKLLLTELQKIILAGQRSVMLKDGSLGILPEEWISKYGLMLRHGKVSGNQVRVARWLAFSEQETAPADAVLKTAIPINWWQKWKLWQDDNRQYELPPSITATLRPYQQKGYEWMMLLAEAGAGGCLADDMGLGKTLQTICFLASRLHNDTSSKHLIVCPSSLLYNWQQEIMKFLPTANAVVYHGANRDAEEFDKSGVIVITSYGTMRSDISKLSEQPFDTLVLDESHHIKNPGAQVTVAANQLQALTRIALSGTPVMNNTFDLYAQLSFLLPGMFGSQEFFRRQYADGIDRDHDPEKTLALRKLTAPFILRRTKQQVADDLPEKTESIMWCSMSPSQKLLYESVKTDIGNSIFLNIKNEGLGKSKLAVLAGMMKLRQLCNSPLLLPEAEQSTDESVKTRLLMNELSNDLKDHKVLVFSQFTRMLNLLGEACEKEELAYFHFDGQTAPAKRAEMVSQFQEPGNPVNIFLISLKAGNTGLNLTAADYVFLFDPWWNTAVQQQAIDRAHRIGQTKNVFAYKMICKDTIEERIIEIQQRKKMVADDLISEDEGFVRGLTEEDIRFLFS